MRDFTDCIGKLCFNQSKTREELVKVVKQKFNLNNKTVNRCSFRLSEKQPYKYLVYYNDSPYLDNERCGSSSLTQD